MALWRVRLTQNQQTLVPRDRVSMTWGVEGAEPDTADLTSLAAAWVTMLNTSNGGAVFKSRLAVSLSPIDLTAFPAAGGAAVAQFLFTDATRVGTGTGTLPSEVAMAVSQMIATTYGTRPRGRTFWGPFSSGITGTGARPTQTYIDTLLWAAGQWHAALVGRSLTPCVIDAGGTVKRGDIVAYQVDNSYDTIRSRGYDYNARSSLSV